MGFLGECDGPAQPTEEYAGKALKRPTRDLGEPSLALLCPAYRRNPQFWSGRQGLLGSIEAGRTNRVISPCYLDISPSDAAPADRYAVSRFRSKHRQYGFPVLPTNVGK